MKMPIIYPCRCNDNTEKAKAWCAYIQYLHDWAESHAECEYHGMTPACFGEFMDNEYNDYRDD